MEKKFKNSFEELISGLKKATLFLGVLYFTGIALFFSPSFNDQYLTAYQELTFLSILEYDQMFMDSDRTYNSELTQTIDAYITDDSTSFYHKKKINSYIDSIAGQYPQVNISQDSININLSDIIVHNSITPKGDTINEIYSEFVPFYVEYYVPEEESITFLNANLNVNDAAILNRTFDNCTLNFKVDDSNQIIVNYSLSCITSNSIKTDAIDVFTGYFRSKIKTYKEGRTIITDYLNDLYNSIPDFITTRTERDKYTNLLNPSGLVPRYFVALDFFKETGKLLHEIGDYNLNEASSYVLSKSEIDKNVSLLGTEIPSEIGNYLIPLTLLFVQIYLIITLIELQNKEDFDWSDSVSTYFPFYQSTNISILNFFYFVAIPTMYCVIFLDSYFSFRSSSAIMSALQLAQFYLILVSGVKIFLMISQIRGISYLDRIKKFLPKE